MRILICNERFLFRFGVDRVLLMLGTFWKKAGHEIVMMGTKLDSTAVEKCSDRFIPIPEAPDYFKSNTFVENYLRENWDNLFDGDNTPDIALVAGWPFYTSIGFLKEKCGCAFFHDYGAVPTEGMSGGALDNQMLLRKLRRENLRDADRVIAISSFLEETQSKLDVEGLIPTSYVHLGIDHIAMQLWDKKELSISDTNVLDDIKGFKEAGYKIIFQPGRWENGNYKNSAASFDIVRNLHKNGYKVKVLVLSNEKDMGGIPEDLKDAFYCLGFIDDETMKSAMMLSDVGISPTLWEGFDLPLGEMQYLDKPMFVFNVGAHPEVASDKYFLCENTEEMCYKLVKTLRGEMPFSSEEFLALCDSFRKVFTWQNCADKMLNEMKEIVDASTVLFVDVTNACHDPANSGVMRVTRKLSHHLMNVVETIFVEWDKKSGSYVLPNDTELKLLCSYGGPISEKIANKSEEGARKHLDELLPKLAGKKKVLLVTETINSDTLEQATKYLHNRDIAVAAVFHDAIPVLRPELVSKEVAENHAKYMTALADLDMILPTANHNGDDLLAYWHNGARYSPAGTGYSLPPVITAPLAAEVDGVSRYRVQSGPYLAPSVHPVNILFVSTLEPRKNHIRFLEGYELFRKVHPQEAQNVTLTLVGNRYAGDNDTPVFVENYCQKDSSAKWLGVVDDDTLKKLYADCNFTVYPSQIEGFGMPIIESLWSGKPCLCSDSGSVGELAKIGGCCTVDVMSVESIADGLHKMISDADYFEELKNQAMTRPITTWPEYATSVIDALRNIKKYGSVTKASKLGEALTKEIIEYFSGCDLRKVIVVSNQYPPDVVGGAEIIAHAQAKTMMEMGLARVLALTVDARPESIGKGVFTDEIDGIKVVRISVSRDVFHHDGIDFFNPVFNDIFDELCRLVRPEIVHGHNLAATSLGIIDIAHRNHAKVCVTLHDNWGFCYKNTLLNNENQLCCDFLSCQNCMKELTAGGIKIPINVRKNYFRRCFEKIDALISPSDYIAKNYIKAGINPRKIHVIWNGINIDSFAENASGKFAEKERAATDPLRVTFAGHFGNHKGIDILIKAVSKLEKGKVIIQLAGKGEEEAGYKTLAKSLGISDYLEFLGVVDNAKIAEVYEKTDIYCLPSRWPENQPVSITEAMASGIPVIATRLGGSMELVKDGVTGYLFENEDPEDLATKIQSFIDDPELAQKMGKAGREIMAENAYKNQVEKIVKLYDSLPDYKPVKSRPIIPWDSKIIPEFAASKKDMDLLLREWIIDGADEHNLVEIDSLKWYNEETLKPFMGV